nr:hypothetical protein [Nocardia mexicana]
MFDAVVVPQFSGHAVGCAGQAEEHVALLRREQLLCGDGRGTCWVVADLDAVLGLDGLGQSAVPAAFGGGFGVEHHLVRGGVDDVDLVGIRVEDLVPAAVEQRIAIGSGEIFGAEFGMVPYDVVVLCAVFPFGRGGHVQPVSFLGGEVPAEDFHDPVVARLGQLRAAADLTGLAAEMGFVEQFGVQGAVEEGVGVVDLFGDRGTGGVARALGDDERGVGEHQGLIDLVDTVGPGGRDISAQVAEARIVHGADVNGGSSVGRWCVGLVGVHAHDVESILAQDLPILIEGLVGENVAGGEHLHRVTAGGP